MEGFIVAVIDGRQYRTDGVKSSISGRLVSVEYLNGKQIWKPVRNPSRRDQVLAAIEPF